ncbi:hypothetical protein EDD99_3478 [Streptomyces sp. 846.5]|nr:hypothetical protein [Streptomyces sp. 846.5]TDU04995.1 hypothetical protein EDD99_3478 [Streptomyces sp. 846.5]
MDDTPTDAQRSPPAHVVVHPVFDGFPPFRRVDIRDTQVGKAYSLNDVAEFCRRAGLEDIDLEADGNVRWIGGGPHQWEPE